MKTKMKLVFILLLLFAGCKTGNEITVINLAYLYQGQTQPMIEGHRVFLENDSTARVFVLYNLAGLVYKRPVGKTAHYSYARLSYQIFDSYESNKITDSASHLLTDSLHYRKNKFIVFDFPVKMKPSTQQLITLHFNDLNTDRGTTTPIEINNLRPTTSQHFLPIDKNGNIVFQPWISGKFLFHLRCANVADGKLFVSYYRRSYPPALPPFSTTEASDDIFPADKVFTVNVIDGKTEILNFEDKGFYLFRDDSTANEGFTTLRFDDEYPEITRPEQMIFPLRYLCSNSEFDKLTQSRNPEWAINDFWFEAGGIDERATELKNEYLARVQDANRYFTSFKEGWKTDRGMISVIFGKPTTVYRRTGIETWIYSQQGNRVAMNFDFYQVENPFTMAEYKLKRLPDYKTPWFFAVDYWRR